jgi:GDPmannose 4,6-dehydratase
MYGKVRETPQTENTPFYPRSPYSVAKQFAHGITVNYRESYGMFTVSGILFNHESPLRGIDFVTRKITAALANIRAGYQMELKLGNLDAKRDWGFAADYVYGMWQMLQQEIPDDYILASGETYSVREFVEVAAKSAGYSLAFEGEGEATKGIDQKTGKVVVSVEKDLYRPAEVDLLQGDPSKAKAVLKWQPKVNFENLVQMMVESDLKRSEKGIITY